MNAITRPAIFITGAAAGIGRATAEFFSRQGWYTGAFDVDTTGLESLKEQLGPDNCFAERLDVTDPDAWKMALEKFTQTTGGRLDVLLNNAGVLQTGLFEEVPLASHQRMADINFKGLMTGCHAAFPYLKATPGARVINLASASAIYGTPIFASYSATKFAVRGLTEALNVEWEKHDIHVSDIMPIFVKSAMTEGVHTKSIEDMGVNLTPDDIAGVIWKAANNQNIGKVHWPVGSKTHQLLLAYKLLPAPVIRFVVKKLSL